jgi:hypothetical protein
MSCGVAYDEDEEVKSVDVWCGFGCWRCCVAGVVGLWSRTTAAASDEKREELLFSLAFIF